MRRELTGGDARRQQLHGRACAALAAAIVVVIGSGGCQILGCEPRRCQLDDEPGACAPGEVCGSDGFCRPVVNELPCGDPPAAATRALSVSISASIGVEAMGNELFGVPASIVTDVRGCTVELGRPLCPIDLAQRPRGVVQPLGALSAAGAEAFAPLLSDSALTHAHNSSVDVAGAFAVEILFRTPSNGGDSAVVTQTSPEGAWGLVMRDGFPLFAAGDRAVVLAGRSDGTWRHVLCTVDAAGVVAAAAAGTPVDERDQADIICIVDGALAPGAPTAFAELADQLLPNGTSPLVLGDVVEAAGDPAVAVVRVWNGDVVDATGLIDDATAPLGSAASSLDSAGIAVATARIDALAEEARARLARYVGLRVTLAGGGEAVFSSNNIDLAFARAQPIEHGRFQRHEFVGGGWPRVAHTAQGLPGLLLEPIRADLLEAAWTACTADARTTMLGRSEACEQGTSVLSRTVAVPSQGVDGEGVPRDAQLVFSVFADLAGGIPELVVEGETVCSGNATKDELPGCDVEVIEDDDESFVRLVHRFTAPPLSTLELQLVANGAIWSAQLEEGVDPTTPMNGQGAVILDQIFVRAPLAAGTSSSLRATVASDGSNIIMAPITVIDGGARFGRATALVTVASTNEQGDEELGFVAFTDVDGAQAFFGEEEGDPFPFLGGVPVHGGVDIGAPVDACPDCTVAPVQIELAGEQSWHTVLLQGVIEPGFLIDGTVLTSGTAPRPLALDIQVQAQAGGCLEHRLADVSFVACVQSGGCSENERLVWQLAEDAPDEPVVVAGPSVDLERAVVGAFETALPATTVGDDDALLFEVRYRRESGGTRLLSLDDADGNEVLRVEDDSGDAVIATSAGRQTIEGVLAPDDGEWTQLTCMIAGKLRCTVNAGRPFDVDVNLTGAGAPARARVGDGVARIAFARVWFLPGLGAADDVTTARLMDARVAASFGLVAAPRPGPFTLIEARDTSTTIDQSGEIHVLGPHWPLIVSGIDGEANTYAPDVDGGLFISGADLATGLGTHIDAAFDGVADGRFLRLIHDFPEPPDVEEVGPVDALALEHVDGADELRVFVDVSSDDSGPRTITGRVPFFDGRTLSLTAQLFRFAVASGGRVTFGGDERGIEGGQTLVIGGGGPLRLRALRVASE